METGKGQDGIPEEIETIESFSRLTKDLKAAAALMSPAQVRYLVDTYYQIQQFRIEAKNQSRASKEVGEPTQLVDWLFLGQHKLEASIRTALGVYSDSHAVGRWLKSVDGIGPVIAAGLMAHIDIHKAQTAGAIWRYAGLDPTNEWLGKAKADALVTEVMGSKSKWTEPDDRQWAEIATKTNRKPMQLMELAKNEQGKITRLSLTSALAKRPWNARLKVLCWKAGESFVKVCNKPTAFYGKVYTERKVQEIQRNASGRYAAQAAAILEAKNYSRDTVAKKAYEAGILPDGHIHARAKRYAVKLFLSHLHFVMYQEEFKREPPFPYAIAILGHAHLITPPGWTKKEGA